MAYPVPKTRHFLTVVLFERLRLTIPGVLLCLASLLGACDNQPEATPVDLTKRVPTTELQSKKPEGEFIHFGLGAMITPKEGVTYYRHLVEYLENQLETPIHVIDKGSYQEFNALLEKGELDIAFVCSGSYVDGHQQFGLELLVVPVAPSGESVYYSYLVVPADSKAQSMADLKGKRFAYTDPLSNTGKLCPDYQIRLLDEDPETFFSETIYTYAHDRSLDAVIEGLVDGAAIDSLIYDYLAQTRAEITSKTKVIARSEPFGIPPVVIRPNLPNTLRERLQKEFLQLHENPRGTEILKGMMLQRFVEGHDSAYDSVRQMRKTVSASLDEE